VSVIDVLVNISGENRMETPQSFAGLMLIGTHHKAGTNWLSSIFREIADRQQLPMAEGDDTGETPGRRLFLHDHSNFYFPGLPREYRGLHMIRDPRDVIVSACFYHQDSAEEWLHVPRRRFEGLTYQQKLNSYSSFEDRLLFEMEHVSLLTIKEMWCWDYRNPAFMELRYEQLIVDESLQLFRELFEFLGFSGPGLDEALEIAYRRSLFSGQVAQGGHVRSGEAGQWRQYFGESHKRRFLDLFGNTLVDLGYEEDHAWAGCSPTGRDDRIGEFILRDIFDVLYHPDDPESHMATAKHGPQSDPAGLVADLQVQVRNRDVAIGELRRALQRKGLV
jgi:hypothetical protein